jgi:hypothetical protein
MIASTQIRRLFTVTLVVVLMLPHVAAGSKRELPHYVVVLPDGYVGWIQVIFSAPNAPKPEFRHNKIILRVDNSGVFKTSMTGTIFSGTHDEFFYSKVDSNGREILFPVPVSYFCADYSLVDSCFDGNETRTDAFSVGRATLGRPSDGSTGNSWFLFVGPMSLRQKMAIPVHIAPGEKYRIDVPEDDPTPGRIKDEK